MRPLSKEMKYPLPEVERVRLRIGATVVLAPFVLIISIFYMVSASFIDATKETVGFIGDCW